MAKRKNKRKRNKLNKKEHLQIQADAQSTGADGSTQFTPSPDGLVAQISTSSSRRST